MKTFPTRSAGIRFFKRLLLVTPLLFAGALIGCPGSLDDFTPFRDGGPACADVPTGIFATSCAIANCHAPPMAMGNLDLTATGLESRVADVNSTSPICGASMMYKLADTNNPAMSLIYLKLKNPPPCGVRMPQVGTPLTDPQTECVLEWLKTLKHGSPTGAGGGGGAGGSGAGGGGGAGGAPSDAGAG